MSANRGYQEILDVLGSQSLIIPIGDPDHENGTRTMVTTVGNGAGNGIVFTYSGDRALFTPATVFQRTPHRLPDVGFDGSANEADSPDAAIWTRDDGSGEGFSFGAWIAPGAVNSRSILAKNDNDSREEWFFDLVTTVGLNMDDNSAAVRVSRRGTTTIPTDGTLSFAVCTYDGGGGATAANGINTYLNAVLENAAATNNASYVTMDDTTSVVELGSLRAGSIQFFEGRMLGGKLGPFFTEAELTAIQVANLYDIGIQYINAGFPPRRRRGR